MTGGFIKLHRCALDSWLWQMPAEQFKVAMTVLMLAHWRPAKSFRGGRALEVPRGSVITCRDDLAVRAGVSVQTVRTALKNLEGAGFLTITSTKKYTVISIVNFDTYQGRDEVEHQQINQESTRNQPGPNQVLTSDQPTHYKEEEREEEKEVQEGEEEHIAPAVAGHHPAQPELFSERAQEPPVTASVDGGTGERENADPAPAGERSEYASDAKAWGRALARRRKAMGVTADELAKPLMIGARRVTQWERGDRAPGPEELEQAEARLTHLERRLADLAAAAVGALNRAAQASYQPTSQCARGVALAAWRWGWAPEKLRLAVERRCADLADFQGGTWLRPDAVFRREKLQGIGEQIDAGGLRVVRSAAESLIAVADEIRRDEDEQRRKNVI
jgi:transcriptional regulator with XRE-family HTH domain